MNCPECGSAITRLGRNCGACGYDFGKELYDKFSFYFSWKSELGRLMELQNSLYSGIANVSAKIQRYEGVLRRDLEARATTATEQGRKKPARARKNKRR